MLVFNHVWLRIYLMTDATTWKGWSIRWPQLASISMEIALKDLVGAKMQIEKQVIVTMNTNPN